MSDEPPEILEPWTPPPPPGPGPRPRPTPGPRLLGGISLFQLMLLVVACAFLIRLTVLAGPRVLLIAILAVPVLVYTYVMATLARRDSERDALLWALATAAGRGMPLGPAVEAVSDQFGRRSKRSASALTWWLDSGVGLPRALDHAPGALPAPAPTLIRVGEATGLLPQALREAAEARAARPPDRDVLRGRIAYLCLVMMVFQGLGGFISYYIAPKFEAIFADFGVPLPAVTMFAITAGHAAIDTGLLPILVLVELATLLYLALVGLGLVRGAVPILDRVARRRHVGVILRSLAVVVEGGRPLAQGVAALAESYPRRWVRRRLIQVQIWLSEGADCWTALRGAGLLLPNEEAILAAAQRVGNLPWALREVAEAGERRLSDRLRGWSQVLFGLAVMAFGALVGLLVVAYFTPIIALIEALIE